MKTVENKKHGRLKVLGCVAAAIALAISSIVLVNCPAGPEFPGNAASASKTSEPVRIPEPSKASSEASTDSNNSENASADIQEQLAEQFLASPGKTTSQDAVSGASGDDSQTYPSADEAPPTTAPAASGGESQKQPVWVADYEDIWVVDSPEWDESTPIYGSTEVSICNVCGADVTGNAAAHGKQHMLAGEGSGHHSEVRETVVGYETVHHDATGHWERVESGGHWE